MSDSTEPGRDRPEVARAEEIVDQAVRTMSVAFAQATFWVLKTGARAREEAEDIWAEAQSASARDRI